MNSLVVVVRIACASSFLRSLHKGQNPCMLSAPWDTTWLRVPMMMIMLFVSIRFRLHTYTYTYLISWFSLSISASSHSPTNSYTSWSLKSSTQYLPPRHLPCLIPQWCISAPYSILTLLCMPFLISWSSLMTTLYTRLSWPTFTPSLESGSQFPLWCPWMILQRHLWCGVLTHYIICLYSFPPFMESSFTTLPWVIDCLGSFWPTSLIRLQCYPLQHAHSHARSCISTHNTTYSIS